MKTTIPNFYKLLAFQKRDKGFTLIELLVAILMSGIMMVGLGAGMMAVLNNSKASAAKTDVKNQLNRAIDYINEDIKTARFAGVLISSGNSADPKDTLAITVLQDDGTELTVKYFLADANNPWLGPKVLMRQEGDAGTPQVLVDRLTENTIDGTEFACSTTETTALSLGGFQACVTEANIGGDPNQPKIYRTQVALFGEISDTEGTRGNSPVLKVSTDITSRSIAPNIDPPTVTFTPLSDLTPLLQWDAIDSATGYELYRCITTDSINDCVPTDLIGSTTTLTEFQETAADTPGSRACYAGVTIASPLQSRLGPVTCTIMSPTNPPAAVTGLTANDQIQPVVQWTYDTTAIEYSLYRCSTTNISTPCSIDPSVDAPIDTFSVLSGIDFSNKVPWSEAINTNNEPAEGEAFCYAVVATNVRGDSSLSNVDCGKLNASLTLNTTWAIAFTNFVETQEQPTDVTWNPVTGANRYEMRRCATSSWTDTCDPETAGSVIFDKLATEINPFKYDEIGLPAADSRYCYAIRAKSDTEVSVFSAAKCATGQAPVCTLNMANLGLGVTPNRKSSETEADRQKLIKSVTDDEPDGNGFFNAPTEFIAPATFGKVLSNVAYEGNNIIGQDTITLPCDAQLTFKWYYVPETQGLGIPELSLAIGSSPKEDLSTLTWTAVAGADKYRLYACQANDGETCIPDVNNFFARRYDDSGLSYTEVNSKRPASGKRLCYSVAAIDTVPNPDTLGDASAPACGATR